MSGNRLGLEIGPECSLVRVLDFGLFIDGGAVSIAFLRWKPNFFVLRRLRPYGVIYLIAHPCPWQSGDFV